MSTISNKLFIAGTLGMAGSALIEAARAFESSIGVPSSPFLPTQEQNAIIFASSAAVLASAVARKIFCGFKLVSEKAEKDIDDIQTSLVRKVEEKTYVTSDRKINMEVAGRSRAGKSLWIKSMFGGLQTCGNPSIFRGTENATVYEMQVGDTRWVIKDTPGLYEFSGDDQVARDNEVILKEIRPNPGEVVDAVIYTIPNEILPDDIRSLVAVYNATPKHAKIFLLLTQCETTMDSIPEIKADRLRQLNEKKEIPEELREKLQNCPVMLSGAINVDVENPTSSLLMYVQSIYQFNEDARRLLVGGLIENQERAAQCMEKLAEPFQFSNEEDLKSIAEYFTSQACAIDAVIPKITGIANELARIETDLKGSGASQELTSRIIEIATSLNSVAVELPNKVEELHSIANRLGDNKDLVSTLVELRNISDKINLRILSEKSRELELLLRNLKINADYLDHSKLEKAYKDLCEIEEENRLVGRFSFTWDKDLINKLGYLAVAVKIEMKKFIPNKPKWDVAPGIDPNRVSVANFNF